MAKVARSDIMRHIISCIATFVYNLLKIYPRVYNMM